METPLWPAEAVWFTRRERQILGLVRAARQPKFIANALGIGVGSVYFHKAALRRKLKLHSDEELLVWACEHPQDVAQGVTHRVRTPGEQEAA
jgi:DNA-binding CsgD family transcriptional regulator